MADTDIAAMLTVDDEAERGKPLPEPELNTDAPADKKEPERNEDGTFKGEKKPEEKVEEKKPEAEKKPEEKRDETVPLAKFLDKTNKLKEQLDQKDITLKQYEQRLAALEAKLPKAEAPKEPDFVEDPKGYVDTKLNGALEKIAEANKKAEETGKQAQESAAAATEQVQLQRFMSDIGRAEQAFVA